MRSRSDIEKKKTMTTTTTMVKYTAARNANGHDLNHSVFMPSGNVYRSFSFVPHHEMTAAAAAYDSCCCLPTARVLLLPVIGARPFLIVVVCAARPHRYARNHFTGGGALVALIIV